MQTTLKCLRWLGLSLLAAWGLVGCSSEEDARYAPDVSKIQADVEIIRFDRQLLGLDTNKISAELQNLQQKYPNFAEIYLNQVLGGAISGHPDSNLLYFLRDPYIRRLGDTIQTVFANTDALEKDIEQLLRHYAYYFPEDTLNIKRVYTFFSGYNIGVFLGDDYLAVGLDFFLGHDHAGYVGIENLRHAYIRRTLNRDHIVSQLAGALADEALAKYRPRLTGNKLIEQMLYNGKRFYVIDALIPAAADSLKYQFSEFQMAYCREGELTLYEHLAKEGLLYSDRFQDFRKYIEVGPFDPKTGLYGNSGSWLGAQMVGQYARRLRQQLRPSQPDVQRLDQEAMRKTLAETTPQTFLQKYKPRK